YLPPLLSFPTRRSSDLNHYFVFVESNVILGQIKFEAFGITGSHYSYMTVVIQPLDQSEHDFSIFSCGTSEHSDFFVGIIDKRHRSEEHTSELQSRFDIV